VGRDLTERDLEMFVLGLYAGEGSKTDGEVSMANTNPAYLQLFLRWLRARFGIDEQRLRAILYLHDGLDIVDATAYWSKMLGIPPISSRSRTGRSQTARSAHASTSTAVRRRGTPAR
jgi:hypothetical protein